MAGSVAPAVDGGVSHANPGPKGFSVVQKRDCAANDAYTCQARLFLSTVVSLAVLGRYRRPQPVTDKQVVWVCRTAGNVEDLPKYVYIYKNIQSFDNY